MDLSCIILILLVVIFTVSGLCIWLNVSFLVMKKGKKGGSADRKKRKLGNYTCEMCAYVTPRSDKLRSVY